MRPAPLGRLGVVALALLWWGASDVCGQVPDQLLGREVRETRLRSGGQAVQDAQLEGLVEIRPGQPFAMDAVRETIVHLMGMGRYIDVQVSAFAEGDGVRVDIDLVPLPEVRRVAFTGDLGLPEHTLRAAVEERFGASPAGNRASDIARAVEGAPGRRRLPAGVGRRAPERSRCAGRRHRAARDLRAQGRRGDRVVPGRRPRRGPRHPVARAPEVGSVLQPRRTPPPARQHRRAISVAGATTRPGPTTRWRSRRAARRWTSPSRLSAARS